MFERDELLEFLNKSVDIGTPNYRDNERLFFYTGTLTEITSEHIKLKLLDGIKHIPLCDIIEIRLSKNGRNNIQGEF